MTDERLLYCSILTHVGIDKQATATAEGLPWRLAKMAVGDGGGDIDLTPDPAQSALINETYRAPLNSLSKDPINPGTWIAELVIPLNVGRWWVRELGLYDDEGALVAVANCPQSYKPLPSQGSVRTQRIRMRFIIGNGGQIELILADDLVFVTPDLLEQRIRDELNQRRRNLLINGNFDIWQRGTSNKHPQNGSLTKGFIADRFRCEWDDASEIVITRQAFALGQAEVPHEPQFFLRWQQKTNGTEGTLCRISQAIESVRTVTGKSVTLSFWAKSDAEPIVSAKLSQVFGTGGAPSGTVITAPANFALTPEWAYYSATFLLPSIAGKTLGTWGNDCLLLEINLAHHAKQTVDIAQIQLEEGALATAFDSRPIGAELALCQRYYEKTMSQTQAPGDHVGHQGSLVSIVYEGQSSSGSQPLGNWGFKVEKRVSPSVSLYNPQPDGALGQWRSGSNSSSSQNARPFSISTRGVSVDNSDYSLTPQTYYIHATADAEL